MVCRISVSYFRCYHGFCSLFALGAWGECSKFVIFEITFSRKIVFHLKLIESHWIMLYAVGGESPPSVIPVNIITVNTSILRKQGQNWEGPSKESWSGKP